MSSSPGSLGLESNAIGPRGPRQVGIEPATEQSNLCNSRHRQAVGHFLTKTPDLTPVKAVSGGFIVLHDSRISSDRVFIMFPFRQNILRSPVPRTSTTHTELARISVINGQPGSRVPYRSLALSRLHSILLSMHTLDEINPFSKYNQPIIYVPAQQYDGKVSRCDTVRGELCCCKPAVCKGGMSVALCDRHSARTGLLKREYPEANLGNHLRCLLRPINSRGGDGSYCAAFLT